MLHSFQDLLNDKKSMKVFRQNSARVDPNTSNRFSHNETWNKVYNCPYFGLMSLRKKQEAGINSDFRNENILRNFTMGNKKERERY